MSFDNNEKMLKEMLENIIFKKERLETLKKMISELASGTMTPKNFRENIFYQRQEIFEELFDFFPFYIEHLQKSRSIDEFASQNISEYNSKELKQRDDFLIEVFNHLKILDEKLNSS